MEDLSFLKVWDMYSELLTPHQREITDLYFNCDLSLAEIAEQKGVSRQSVSDCINKSKKELEKLEQKLHFVAIIEKEKKQNLKTREAVENWAEKFELKHCEYGKEIEELKLIAEKLPQS